MTHAHFLLKFSQQLEKVETFNILSLERRRPREMKSFAYVRSIPGKRSRWDSNPGLSGMGQALDLGRPGWESGRGEE